MVSWKSTVSNVRHLGGTVGAHKRIHNFVVGTCWLGMGRANKYPNGAKTSLAKQRCGGRLVEARPRLVHRCSLVRGADVTPELLAQTATVRRGGTSGMEYKRADALLLQVA